MKLRPILARARRLVGGGARLTVNAVSNPAYSSTVLDAGSGRRTLLGTGRKGACAVLRPTALAPGTPRTAVVLGIARGGTSMAAGALRGLGVHMGDDLGFNHEDARIQQIVSRRAYDTFAALARRRDAAHDLWGFKFPEASMVMDRFHPGLRAPHYLFVIRHPVARGQSTVRRTGGALGASVIETLKSYEAIFAFLESIDAPVLLVNYEQATADRDTAVREFAGFLGIDASPDRMARAAAMITRQGEGYVNLPEHGFYAAERERGEAGAAIAVPPGGLAAGEIDYAADRASVWSAPDGGFPQAFVLGFALAGGRAKRGDAVRLYYDYEGIFHAGHRLLVELGSTAPALRIDAAPGLRRVAIVPMNGRTRVTDVRFEAAG